MQTIQEKITFAAAAAVYLLMHLRGGQTIGEMLSGTIIQVLTTAPYAIGFTFILVRIISFLYQGRRLPWDRIARIFFTGGIFFGFFFGLYEHMELTARKQEAASAAGAGSPSL